MEGGGSNHNNNADANYIADVSDIENLVTDGDKLVINYYDAYIWTVFFDETDLVDRMIYIYKFSDETEAESMVKSRSEELKKNKSMKIENAYNVENYVVVELVDESFENVSRSILENNFSLLIVK